MKMVHKRWIAVILMAVMLMTSASAALAAALSEGDNNNDIAHCDALPFDTKMRGSIDKNTDKDYFSFKVETARQVEFRLKQWGFRTTIELINIDHGIKCYEKKLTGLLGSRTEVFLAKRNLIPGNYAIVLSSGKKGNLGRYELSIRDVKPATPGIMFESKTARVTIKMDKQLKVTANPSYFDAPTGVTFKSNNKRVATVDENTGLVSGNAYGTATITATASDGKTASCVVTVASNLYNRSKPLFASPKKLYGSVRRMLYTEDALIIYMFLLNKTGKPFEGSGDFKLSLHAKADPGTVIATSSNDGWRPKNGLLPNNLYQTVKFVIAKDAAGKLDLGGKAVYPVITFEKVSEFEQLGKP